MIKIDLYNPETEETLHYEQRRIPLAKIIKAVELQKAEDETRAELMLFEKRIDSGEILNKKDSQRYIELSSGNEIEQLEKTVSLVVDLFDNPKVTRESILNGLDMENGLDTLTSILHQAMGGVESDSQHPAKK